jgi:hypothetical protein
LNSKRYFSNIIDFIDIEEINALFEIEPPFNIYSKKSHSILSKEYANTQGSSPACSDLKQAGRSLLPLISSCLLSVKSKGQEQRW